jgi:hypothetical protein
VSVKLIPEICINKASSNSRLTAAGRGATASDSHSQNFTRLFFFSSSFYETMTELELEAEEIIETVLHLNSVFFFCFGLVFLGFLFVCFVFCFFPFDEAMTELPLRQQLQDWRLKD